MPAGRAPPVSPIEGLGIALVWGGSGSIGTGARPSPGDPSANGPSLFASVELGARAGDRVAVATPPARASGGKSEPDSLSGVGANHAEPGLASGGDGTDVIPAVSIGGEGSGGTGMMSAVVTGDTGGGGAGETAGGFAPFCVFPASGGTLEDRSRTEALGPFSPLSGTTEIAPLTTAATTGFESASMKLGAAFPHSPFGRREARPNGRFGALRCVTTAGRAIESSSDSSPPSPFPKPNPEHCLVSALGIS